MASLRSIKLVEDFSKKPYGRYPEDGEFSGQRFRNDFLIPALHRNEHVVVDLSGFNLYGRSFIDEAFGGLVRDGGFSLGELKRKLEIQHSTVPAICKLAWTRIEVAARARQ